MTTETTVFTTFPVLHTRRLDLIELTQEHAEDIFRLFGNDQVTRYYNIVTLSQIEQARKILSFFQDRYAQRAAIRWGIALKGTTTIIGTLGFNNFTRQHRANIGYDLLPAYWNQGFIPEALWSIIGFGFQQLGVNRIEAEVMPGNVASERVLQKLGFTREGLLRDWLFWNGKYFDMTMFSLLRNDFLEQEGVS